MRIFIRCPVPLSRIFYYRDMTFPGHRLAILGEQMDSVIRAMPISAKSIIFQYLLSRICSRAPDSSP